jgi:hypothetical protein
VNGKKTLNFAFGETYYLMNLEIGGTRLGVDRKVCKILWEIPKKRYHLEDRGVDRRMGSQRISGRLADGGEWI